MARKILTRRISFWGQKISFFQIVVFFSLVVFCFLIRTYRLTSLPIFADEAIYIRWSQVMRNEPGLRFLPLQDGKQPLFMWLTIPFLKLFSDPLFAGRLVSVFAGVLTLTGLVFLAPVIGEPLWVGLTAGFLYTLSPFTFFFDRMALADSLLSAFGIWSLIFSFLLARFKRLDVAMILGMILGGGLLTKSPVIFFVLMAAGVVFGYQLNLKEKKKFLTDKLKFVPLLLVSYLIALTIYNILRLGPNFQMIALRNRDYVWPVSEVIRHPWDPLKPHLGDIGRYYSGYLTWSVFILGILGVFLVLDEANFLLLFLWWFLPLMAQAFLARVFTARYILFGVPLFLFFGANFLVRIWPSFKSRLGRFIYFFLFLILLPGLFFIANLWHQPEKAPLPRDEFAGYLQDWTAGQGVKETAEYLKALPREPGIVVGTEGYFGTLPDGLQIYLEGEKDITAIGVGYPIKTIPEPLVNAKEAGDQVFLLVNQSRFLMADEAGLRLIKEYPKPGKDKLLLFEVL